jgi:UDP-N-acetylmuramate--alanine ligase
MSALARYFKFNGKQVAGYDKVETPLTLKLSDEGIAIHYEDLGPEIPSAFQNPENTLVVYTPAIKALGELAFFQAQKFTIEPVQAPPQQTQECLMCSS